MKLRPEEITRLEEVSRKLRIETFDLARQHGGYHFGGALSAVDIMVSLYEKVLQPQDIFILSKGHAAFSWYPLLRKQGFNPVISGHPDMDIKNGIWATTGSLGMGFPTGAGIAFAKKMKSEEGNVYVLMGETEFQEGTGWETLLHASQQRLDNLVGIVDYNLYQGSGSVRDILSLGDLESKFRSFGADVLHANGHSHEELVDKFYQSRQSINKPTMIIAHTVKGKRISFMEQDPANWHARFPVGRLKQVYEELGAEYIDDGIGFKAKKSVDLRKEFGKIITEIAGKDSRIFVLAGDYESGLDEFKAKFPERYRNMGTTEQSMISIASGMAIAGLRPVVYSITPFILERPFEQVKIGLDQQKVPVMLVGFDDYPEHGPTHTALDAVATAALFKNIKSYFPKNAQETRDSLMDAYNSNGPTFIRLLKDYNVPQ